MSDGAHQGVRPERAFQAVLGGEQPSEDEMESVEDMRVRLLGLTREDATDYNSTAEYAASLILHFILEDAAQRIAIPVESEYDWSNFDSEVVPGKKPRLLRKGLYDVMKEAGPPYDEIGNLGLSGFMWGWAVNAARRCVNMPPKPNPAIHEIT